MNDMVSLCACVYVMFSIYDPLFYTIRANNLRACFFTIAVHAMFIFDNHIKSQLMARNTNFFFHTTNIHTPPKHVVCFSTMHHASILLLLMLLQLIANVTQLTFHY